MSVRLRKWKTKEGKVQEAWWVDVKSQHPNGKVKQVRKASPINARRGAEEGRASSPPCPPDRHLREGEAE